MQSIISILLRTVFLLGIATTGNLLVFGMSVSPPPITSSECLVVGCGVLGTSLCKQMVESPAFASCKVTAVTKTTNRHEQILADVLGGSTSKTFSVTTADECKGKKFANVVFCAPPSGFEDYPAAVKDVIENLWSGPTGEGVFVFTASGGVYGTGNDGEIVNEKSPVADPDLNPRSGRLINAEKIVLSNGGCSLRLAGLYNLNRGAHNFWLTSGKDPAGRKDGIVNQLHYDDAAGATLAALVAGPTVVSGNPYLISDGNPMTREDICKSALKAKCYQGMALPKFAGDISTDPKGKVYDGAASNKALKWDPMYISFDSFMTSQA